MSGLSEVLSALSMTVGRGAGARLVADVAGLTPRDLVVDVGCGPGTAVREAGRRGTPAIGADPSGVTVRLARHMSSIGHSDRAYFIEASAEALPLSDHCATVAWALSSFHHWANGSRGLAEVLRVLVPGGRLLIAEQRVKDKARGHARHGLTEQAVDALQLAAESTGFLDVSREVHEVGHRTLIILTATSPGAVVRPRR